MFIRINTIFGHRRVQSPLFRPFQSAESRYHDHLIAISTVSPSYIQPLEYSIDELDDDDFRSLAPNSILLRIIQFTQFSFLI